MNNLPKNPIILLSVINTKLRDYYDSLSSLCDDLDESEDENNNLLNNAGYYYDSEKNQFLKK